jgi:acetyl-CoA carboxylase carboxyl transferase subunit beta
LSWYKREKEGIRTSRAEQIQAPDGLWIKCPACKNPTHFKELQYNYHVCPACDYHQRIGSADYFSILFDRQDYEAFADDIRPQDPLEFQDTKRYTDRLEKSMEKSGLSEAVSCAKGSLEQRSVVISAMDFEFIGGSMGSVVGARIDRAINQAIADHAPLIIVSKSGGARMMEGNLSLMQMAKASAGLAKLEKHGLPYISVMTDPTTGGVTASFAMLGDINLAEPGALIGFAGPRVIRETIGRDLPEGFQRSEFLMEHGFLDAIVHRHSMKRKIATMLKLLSQN